MGLPEEAKVVPEEAKVVPEEAKVVPEEAKVVPEEVAAGAPSPLSSYHKTTTKTLFIRCLCDP